MHITVNDFYVLSQIAHENRLLVPDDVFKEINKITVFLSNDEFDTILKRKTISNFVKLTFGNDYYDNSFIKYLDEKLASTDINSDVSVTVSRGQLDSIKSAFEEEFNSTFNPKIKEKMVEYARDINTNEIDKIDTVEFSDKVIHILKDTPLKYMNKELEDVLVKYAPSRFKLK